MRVTSVDLLLQWRGCADGALKSICSISTLPVVTTTFLSTITTLPQTMQMLLGKSILLLVTVIRLSHSTSSILSPAWVIDCLILALSALIGYIVPSKIMSQFLKSEINRKVENHTCWEYAKWNHQNITPQSGLCRVNPSTQKISQE